MASENIKLFTNTLPLLQCLGCVIQIFQKKMFLSLLMTDNKLCYIHMMEYFVAMEKHDFEEFLMMRGKCS